MGRYFIYLFFFWWGGGGGGGGGEGGGDGGGGAKGANSKSTEIFILHDILLNITSPYTELVDLTNWKKDGNGYVI